MGIIDLEQSKKRKYDALFDKIARGKHFVDKSWLENALVYVDEGVVSYQVVDFLVKHLELQYYKEEKKNSLRIKRLFDILLSSLFIFVCIPFFILIAAMIKLTSSGPIIFRQVRIGEAGVPFWIYKFRTMRTNSKRKYSFLKDGSNTSPIIYGEKDPRLTVIGGFLRKWSLDEIPQFFNVLKGEMSLVGPRPLTPDDSFTMSIHDLTRLALQPGVTGLWQAINRQSMDGKQKIALDVLYVENFSFSLDLRLLLLTIPSVLIPGFKFRLEDVVKIPNVNHNANPNFETKDQKTNVRNAS